LESGSILPRVDERVLIVAPHTDDAELGCGATLMRLIEDGSSVHVAAFSSAAESLPPGSPGTQLADEFRASMTEVYGLGDDQISLFDYRVRWFPESRQEILEQMVVLRNQFQPTLVLAPSEQDIHQDHAVIHKEATRAFARASLLCWELPWNRRTGGLNFYVSISEAELKAKIEALGRYESQVELRRPYFTRDVITSWARLRGAEVGVEYAEAFEIHRLIV
jgi:LmbE family N-acetylglucosaminyl deacetylase